MSKLAMDTHEFVKDMTQKGMPEDQAAALAKFCTSLVEGRLATQEDLKHLEERLTLKMEALDQSLNARMDALEQRLDARMDALEQRFDQEIKQLEKRIDLKMNSLEHRLSVKILGSQIATAMIVIAVLKYT